MATGSERSKTLDICLLVLVFIFQPRLNSSAADKNGYFNNPEDFAELILEFIKLSLPDLAYKQVGYMKREKVPFLNGYWNKSLNVQFGYGLFE